MGLGISGADFKWISFSFEEFMGSQIFFFALIFLALKSIWDLSRGKVILALILHMLIFMISLIIMIFFVTWLGFYVNGFMLIRYRYEWYFGNILPHRVIYNYYEYVFQLNLSIIHIILSILVLILIFPYLRVYIYAKKYIRNKLEVGGQVIFEEFEELSPVKVPDMLYILKNIAMDFKIPVISREIYEEIKPRPLKME